MDILSQLIPSLSEGLFVFDAAGRLVLLNPSAERILGRSEKAVLGLSVEELFPSAAELPDLVRLCLEGGRAHFKSGVQIADAEGKASFLTVSVSPLEEPDGRLVGAALLARDETLLRQIDTTYRRAEQLASFNTLNLGMAHEIKNPLGGIKGATQLLRADLADGSPLTEHCDLILREVERIDGLLENMLQAVTGRGATFTEVNIHEVLNNVIELVALSEGPAQASFLCSYDPSLPPIRADRNGLTQVFMNLVKNAVEASPPSGRITLRTSIPVISPDSPASGMKGGALEVDIEDEGPGFAPDVKDFATPFFTTKPKGVGLGLAITQQIIQNHGGVLDLANLEGGGARVRVFLPLTSPR